MPERLVTVATFGTAGEANLAKNHLESQGIAAFLADEESVGMLWYLGTALGGVKVQVAENHQREALRLLDPCLPEVAADSEKTLNTEHPVPQPNAAESSPNPPASAAKPENISQRISAASTDAEPSAEDWEPDPEEFVIAEGEDLAQRTWRAAVFGIIFPPLTVYSFWLLVRLFFWQGELSGTLKVLGSFVLNCAVLALWTFFFWVFLAFR